MLASTEKFLAQGFGDRVMKAWTVASILGGSPARRAALINKALKRHELLRLHRGVYLLAAQYRAHTISSLAIANRIIPGSFISFETALSFHGWIPEKITLVMSTISAGRSRSVPATFGGCAYQYYKIPVNEYTFLNGVLRKEHSGKPFLIAGPLRALADYVYKTRAEKIDLPFLIDGLRIEKDNIALLRSEDFDEILVVYRSKRVRFFLENLRQALGQ